MLELAELVRPAGGQPPPLQKIWDLVLESDESLPGSWNTTISGALEAARSGDWSLCTYLAACCFREKGAPALAQVDESCLRTLWLEVAAPILVEIPKGLERVLVQRNCKKDEPSAQSEWIPTDQLFDVVSPRGDVWLSSRHSRTEATFGTVQAQAYGRLVDAPKSSGCGEHFRTGDCLELSQFQWQQRHRLRHFLLTDEDRLQLQHLLSAKDSEAATSTMLESLIDKTIQLAVVPGTWYHVLAYPFAGHLSKALLRPVGRSWQPSQRQAARGAISWLGETLISQCAKAGNWELVEVLLRAGVPCPDLSREFEMVCGNNVMCRKQWRRDLQAATTDVRWYTLMEMAAFAKEVKESPLVKLLNALRQAGKTNSKNEVLDLKDLRGGTGGRPAPLIVTAAAANRWDIVATLLNQPESTFVASASLLSSPAAAKCSPTVLSIAESRAAKEQRMPLTKPGNVTSQAQSLSVYFKQMHSGLVLGADALPAGWQVKDRCLENPEGIRVLHKGLRFGGTNRNTLKTSEEILVFIAVSRGELAEARMETSSSVCSILPINLSGYTAAVEPAPQTSKAWLAVLCPVSYVQKAADTSSHVVQVPVNCIPTPHVVRTSLVRISVVTPCCHAALPDAPVYVADHKVGKTDVTGVLKVSLPPGQYRISSPGVSFCKELISVEADGSPVDVCLLASGELFCFLIDLSNEDDKKDGVMLTTCKEKTEGDEYGVFKGIMKIGGTAVALPAKDVGLCVPAGQPCSGTLSQLALESLDGRKCEANPDIHSWIQDCAHECEVALLFANGQGFASLLGPRPLPISTITTSKNEALLNSSNQSKPTKKPLAAPVTASKKLAEAKSLVKRARACSASHIARRANPLVVSHWQARRPLSGCCALRCG